MYKHELEIVIIQDDAQIDLYWPKLMTRTGSVVWEEQEPSPLDMAIMLASTERKRRESFVPPDIGTAIEVRIISNSKEFWYPATVRGISLDDTDRLQILYRRVKFDGVGLENSSVILQDSDWRLPQPGGEAAEAVDASAVV